MTSGWFEQSCRATAFTIGERCRNEDRWMDGPSSGRLGAERISSALAAEIHLAVERVGPDEFGKVFGDRSGGGAARLARPLVLEARQKLATESSPRIAREHLRPRLSRELLRSPSDYLPAGSDLQDVRLGVSGRGDVATHVPHDDLRCPGRTISLPAGRHAEDPSQVPACLLEGHSVTVEYIGETDVVKHRRDVKQFVVEGDAVLRGVHRSPQVGADTVVE